MNHVAIDLGGRKSQICIRAADGSVLKEHSWNTHDLGGYLQAQPKSRVILETCAESMAVAEAARAAGHEVRVVPATLVRSLGVGERRLKTDKRDALALSKVSCLIDLPSVHIRSMRARDLRTLYSMRDGLVQARTQLSNTVSSWLRTQLMRVKSGTVETMPKRVRAVFLSQPEGLPTCVDRQLDAIHALTEQIAEASKEIAETAKQDAHCQRFMTVPGVGPITAVAFRSALDEVERFPDAHHVESYLGLTPSEDSSSERQRRGSITKAGNGPMRRLLVQASWCLWRTQPNDPMVQWAKAVADRRGRHVAVTALARKLSGVLFALWRDQTHYIPSHAARPQAPSAG